MGKHQMTVEAKDIAEVNVFSKSSDALAGEIKDMLVREVCVEEDHGSEVKGLGEVASPDKANGSSNSSDEEVTVDVDSEIHAELLFLPPHGSEVFIGGLTHDATKEYVKELCETFGKVFKLELVKDKDANKNKAYAFVTFTTKDAAHNAIKEISSKGKEFRCSLFRQKHKLFIGSIPNSLSEEELRKILQEIGPGIENIDLFKISQHPGRNSGAFVEYYNHDCADYAWRKLTCADFKLDGSTPNICWADDYGSSDDSNDSPAAARPIIMGIGRVPSGMTLVPIMLPDGQLGYILQRKESLSPARSVPPRRSNRSRHSSDNNNSDSDWSIACRNDKLDGAINQSRRRRYHPY